MTPAADVRLAVGPRLILDGKVDDLQVEARRAEEQIEVPERVEVAEITSSRDDPPIRRPVQDLRPAQRVLDLLAHDRLEQQREHLVAHHVREAHRAGLDVVDESRAIDELRRAFGPDAVEAGQLFRSNAQIAVQDHEQLVIGATKLSRTAFPFPAPDLRDEAGRHPLGLRDDILDLLRVPSREPPSTKMSSGPGRRPRALDR